MNRWAAFLVSSLLAACGGAAPTPAARATRPSPSAPAEVAQSKPSAAPRLSSMGIHAERRTACVVHQEALACSEPWLSIPEPAAGLAIGAGQGCVVATSGALYCFGQGAQGALEPLARVPGLGKIIDVALETGSPVCAIDADGKVFCWGLRDEWRSLYEVPTHVPTPARALDVSSCHEGPCLTLEDGTLAVVASHNPGSGAILSAFAIAGSRQFTSVSFAWQDIDGGRLACGLRAGRVACAGDATGDAATILRNELLPLGAGVSFAANKYDACIVTPEERVRCRAKGGPIEIAGVVGAIEVVVRGVGDWACARLKDGGVRCFEIMAGPQELHDPIAAASAAARR